MTPAETRLRMAELAFAGEPGDRGQPIELERGGPATRWTRCSSWRALGDLFLIMGADQLAVVRHVAASPTAIRELATLVVAARTGFDVPGGGAVVLDDAARRPLVDGRAASGSGAGRRGLMPAAVLALIRAQGLYGGTPC